MSELTKTMAILALTTVLGTSCSKETIEVEPTFDKYSIKNDSTQNVDSTSYDVDIQYLNDSTYYAIFYTNEYDRSEYTEQYYVNNILYSRKKYKNGELLSEDFYDEFGNHTGHIEY